MCQCDWTTTSPDVAAVFTPAKEAGWDLFQILSSYAVMFPGLSPEFWSEARGLEQGIQTSCSRSAEKPSEAKSLWSSVQ